MFLKTSVPCDGKERRLQDSMRSLGYIQNTALSEERKVGQKALFTVAI